MFRCAPQVSVVRVFVVMSGMPSGAWGVIRLWSMRTLAGIAHTHLDTNVASMRVCSTLTLLPSCVLSHPPVKVFRVVGSRSVLRFSYYWLHWKHARVCLRMLASTESGRLSSSFLSSLLFSRPLARAKTWGVGCRACFLRFFFESETPWMP